MVRIPGSAIGFVVEEGATIQQLVTLINNSMMAIPRTETISSHNEPAMLHGP